MSISSMTSPKSAPPLPAHASRMGLAKVSVEGEGKVPRARSTAATDPKAIEPENRPGLDFASGVAEILPIGIGVIGFEGVQLDVPEIENLVGAIPRVRGISATGVGLEPVLEQGGRAPSAGLDGLKNAHGGPDRIEQLGRTVGARTQHNLEVFRAEASIRPVVREVSEEALRMLDAYLNRTDQLHPMSTEMLAQAFTGAGERMPATGEPVPIVDFDEPSSLETAREAGMRRWREAADRAAALQIEAFAARRGTAERVASELGFFELRGALIDQRL